MGPVPRSLYISSRDTNLGLCVMNLAPVDLDFISELLKRKASIVLGREKAYLIEARLSRVARDAKLASTRELVDRIRRHDRRLEEAVVEAMLTHETSFFRDRHPFDALRRTVLPRLIESRASSRTLSIWSAACSSGQEPYSLAMLLLDAFPELGRWKVVIHATDLSTSVLKKAQSGRYTQLEVGRGLPPGYAQRYFRRDGMDYVIAPEVRRMISFQQCNLMGPWPSLPQLDVIFLRNVMIYFNGVTKESILRKMHRILHPDGRLFLGSTENIQGMDSYFEREAIGGSVCFKRK